MDISAVILHKLLKEKNIEVYSRLKLSFIDPAYSTLFSVIRSYYDKYGTIPSFEDLELKLREGQARKLLATLKLLEIPDVSIEVAFDALVDQYTQNEAIKELERFVDKLPLYDTEEIKTNLSSIAMSIEEKTLTSESIVTMADMPIFQHEEDLRRDRVYLGLNNEFDAAISGAAKQELIVIGGKRGSGKSIVCSNLFVNQYVAGNTSLYFSIEMSAKEINQRNLAILASVEATKLKNTSLLSEEDVTKLAKVRAEMFQEGDKAFEEFLDHRDKFRFEESLMRHHKLKPDNQMIIIDDRNLTIGAIDLHIGRTKAKFPNLSVVLVDYINQIVLDGATSMYDWQPQIEIAKKLKNLARKHDVVMVSPYQIDATGEARFAKGILDSPDIALVLDTDDTSIEFKTTKIRGGPPADFICPFNKKTLKISPISIERVPKETETKTKKKQETSEDLPWNT